MIECLPAFSHNHNSRSIRSITLAERGELDFYLALEVDILFRTLGRASDFVGGMQCTPTTAHKGGSCGNRILAIEPSHVSTHISQLSVIQLGSRVYAACSAGEPKQGNKALTSPMLAPHAEEVKPTPARL
jgi:hypothetical protein